MPLCVAIVLLCCGLGNFMVLPAFGRVVGRGRYSSLTVPSGTTAKICGVVFGGSNPAAGSRDVHGGKVRYLAGGA